MAYLQMQFMNPIHFCDAYSNPCKCNMVVIVWKNVLIFSQAPLSTTIYWGEKKCICHTSVNEGLINMASHTYRRIMAVLFLRTLLLKIRSETISIRFI